MKLTFCGGVRGVTGSCYLLETDTHKLLIDCGMHQGEGQFQDVTLEAFPFEPSKIDAVVLTHAHYDHCGRLPILTQKGFKGSIYCTPPTKALAHLILQDAHHVMVENSEKMGTPIFFTLTDIEQADEAMRVINYHTQFEPIPGVLVMLHDAGHILGSAFVTLKIAAHHMKDKRERTFVFSGDLGNADVPILPPTEGIDTADVIVVESTYGDRDHESSDVRMDKLKDMIDRIVGRGGTLLIPAFSVERTQELIYELDRLIDTEQIPDVPIYLDSPLAIRATEVYNHFSDYLRFDRSIYSSPDRDFFSFPNLHVTLSVDASRKINEDLGPKIIIAGAGMMTGGRILHHLKRYIEDERAGIFIIGYQAEGSLGRRIFDGAEEVQIHHETHTVKAHVEAIGAFSSHADRTKLREWVKPAQGEAKQIYLVHGDPEVKPVFKTFLEEEVKGEIIIPQYWQGFEY